MGKLKFVRVVMFSDGSMNVTMKSSLAAQLRSSLHANKDDYQCGTVEINSSQDSQWKLFYGADNIEFHSFFPSLCSQSQFHFQFCFGSPFANMKTCLVLLLEGNLNLTLDLVWLRDHCRCQSCYDFVNSNRRVNVLDTLDDISTKSQSHTASCRLWVSVVRGTISEISATPTGSY
jgi:hypothetical protein